MGCERLVALMKENPDRIPAARPDAYVLHQGEGAASYAFALADALRTAGHAVVLHAGGGSFKSQMKKADASGAWLALVVGEDEMHAGEVSVKMMRKSAEQQRVGRARALEQFNSFLQKAKE
jgi:histidyl-tRNA synthetase